MPSPATPSITYLSDQPRRKTVSVFGGAGGWGSLITETLREADADVHIVDPRYPESLPPQEAARISDSLVFAVSPSTEILSIRNQIQGSLREGQVLLDVATNKGKIRGALEDFDGRGLSVCSTHPLCAPDVDTRGMDTILIPVGQNHESATEEAKALYEKLGMRIWQASFEEHRAVMDLHQGLPHLVSWAVAAAVAARIRQPGFPRELWSNISTANSSLHEAAMYRVISQNLGISARIIEALRETEDGRQLMQDLLRTLMGMSKAGQEEIVEGNARTLEQLDPDGSRREKMAPLTRYMAEEIVKTKQ